MYEKSQGRFICETQIVLNYIPTKNFHTTLSETYVLIHTIYTFSLLSSGVELSNNHWLSLNISFMIILTFLVAPWRFLYTVAE